MQHDLNPNAPDDDGNESGSTSVAARCRDRHVELGICTYFTV